jgi:hypothetical protein
VTRTTDAQFRAAQQAYDLRDDEPRRCKTCALDEAKPCRHDPECQRWERCERCEREPEAMERGGKRVCVECAHEIDFEEDDDSDAGFEGESA